MSLCALRSQAKAARAPTHLDEPPEGLTQSIRAVRAEQALESGLLLLLLCLLLGSVALGLCLLGVRLSPLLTLGLGSASAGALGISAALKELRGTENECELVYAARSSSEEAQH